MRHLETWRTSGDFDCNQAAHLPFRSEDQQCRMCEQKISEPVTIIRQMSLNHRITRIFTCECSNLLPGPQKEQRRHVLSMIVTGQPGEAFAVTNNDREPGSSGLHEKHFAKNASPRVPARQLPSRIRLHQHHGRAAGSLCPPDGQISNGDLLSRNMGKNSVENVARNAAVQKPIKETTTERASINMPAQTSEAKLQSPELSDHRRDQHQCMLCDRKVSVTETIKEHLMKCHGIPEVYSCACCDWSFSHITGLRKHMSSMLNTGQPGEAVEVAKSDVEPGSLCPGVLLSRNWERRPREVCAKSESPSVWSSSSVTSPHYMSDAESRTPPTSGFFGKMAPQKEDEYRQNFREKNSQTSRSAISSSSALPRRRGRRSKDEQLASSLGLPATAKEIAEMSLYDLQKILKNDRLTEYQKSLIKKIRRRGKNTVAARTCRQRRGDRAPSQSVHSNSDYENDATTEEASNASPFSAVASEERNLSKSRQLKRKSSFCIDDLLFKKMSAV